MRKYFVCLPVAFFLLTLCGCQTVKNTALGVGATAYGFGKGVADDTYNTYKAVEKADDWFAERYW